MLFRLLGNTGLRVSVLGLGGHWRTADGRRYEDRFEGDDVPAAVVQNRSEVVSACIDAGVNYIDITTAAEAMAYGCALAGRRDRVIIGADDYQWSARNPSCVNVQALTTNVERCLTRLWTDYLDLWRVTAEVHGRNTDAEIEAILETADRLHAAGKIRHLGLSSHHREWLHDTIARYDAFEVVLVPCPPFASAAAEPLSGRPMTPLHAREGLGEGQLTPLPGREGLGEGQLTPLPGREGLGEGRIARVGPASSRSDSRARSCGNPFRSYGNPFRWCGNPFPHSSSAGTPSRDPEDAGISLPTAVDRSLGIIGIKPFAGGTLFSPYPYDAPPPHADDLARVVLRNIIHHRPEVTCVVPGLSNVAEARNALAAVDSPPLSPDELISLHHQTAAARQTLPADYAWLTDWAEPRSMAM